MDVDVGKENIEYEICPICRVSLKYEKRNSLSFFCLKGDPKTIGLEYVYNIHQSYKSQSFILDKYRINTFTDELYTSIILLESQKVILSIPKFFINKDTDLNRLLKIIELRLNFQ